MVPGTKVTPFPLFLQKVVVLLVYSFCSLSRGSFSLIAVESDKFHC